MLEVDSTYLKALICFYHPIDWLLELAAHPYELGERVMAAEAYDRLLRCVSYSSKYQSKVIKT